MARLVRKPEKPDFDVFDDFEEEGFGGNLLLSAPALRPAERRQARPLLRLQDASRRRSFSKKEALLHRVAVGGRRREEEARRKRDGRF